MIDLFTKWVDKANGRKVEIIRLEINPLEDTDTIFLISEEGRHSAVQRHEFKRRYVSA